MAIYVFLHETYADWELGYVLPELAKAKKKVLTFGLNKRPLKSLGCLTVVPELSLPEVDLSQAEILLLPGGLHWRTFDCPDLDRLVIAAAEKKIPVAAICGATRYLANLKLLDGVKHTSNSLAFLKETAPHYSGQDGYLDSLAVTDQSIITASGLGAAEFTKEILELLKIESPEYREIWYRAFAHGEEPDRPLQSQCIRVKIKPGMTNSFLEWAKTLSSRRSEMTEALKSEGMRTELMFLEKDSSGDYAVLYTRAIDLIQANAAFEGSQLKIDQEAKEIMARTWDLGSIRPLEKLLEINL